jgi:hypothetical protein
MRVLVACERSGRVREAFRELGHDAWSSDLEPAEDGGQHLRGDVLEHLGAGWDLMIAHPPCTYLSRAGARWWKCSKRHQKALEAASFVLALWNAPIERIAIENPIGRLNRFWRYPDQTIQPWMFGHPYTKATCLWLKNLPPLMSTIICAERTAYLPSNTGWNARKGQRSQPGVVSGGMDASRTFPGIAKAMAEQWGESMRLGENVTPESVLVEAAAGLA